MDSNFLFNSNLSKKHTESIVATLTQPMIHTAIREVERRY